MNKVNIFVGLDFGASSLKAVFFKKDNSSPVLTDSRLYSLPSCNDDEILIGLKEIFKGFDIASLEVFAVINCPHTALRKITAPHMPKDELKEGIALEAKNYFPFSIENSILDFEITGEKTEKGIRKIEAIVAVSPKDTVGRYVSLLNKVGIKPVSFMPGPRALKNFIGLVLSKSTETIAILDIGKSFSEITIFSSNNFVFSRKIMIDGDDFTKALTGALMSDRGKVELSFEEAEDVKVSVGIPADNEDRLIKDKISTGQILSLLRIPLGQLSAEIDRCFDYYREETEGGKIDKLILAGGGGALNGLDKFLSRELDVEVAAGIKDYSDIPVRFAKAAGAALGKKEALNLLPVEVREEVRLTTRRITAQAMAVIVIVIGIFVYAGFSAKYSNLYKRIDISKKELAGLEVQLKDAVSGSAISDVLSKEPYWEDVFKELSNIIPPDIYLTHLSMGGKSLTLNGIISSPEKEKSLPGRQAGLSDFMKALQGNVFKDVVLIVVKENKEKSVKEFELKCLIL